MTETTAKGRQAPDRVFYADLHHEELLLLDVSNRMDSLRMRAHEEDRPCLEQAQESLSQAIAYVRRVIQENCDGGT